MSSTPTSPAEPGSTSPADALDAPIAIDQAHASADAPAPAEAPEPASTDTSASPEDAVSAESAAPAEHLRATNEQMSPAACAQELKQRFPALFSGAPKPLKLRIQVDIQQRAPGVFTKNALSAFFRRHTGATSYLIAVSKAPHRFDLDGQPAGEITAEHRQVALDELTRRRTNNESRRELEEQQRRNRAGLLRDFETTTLTRANFCTLKGVVPEELDGLLAIARTEAEERGRQQPPAFERQRRPGPPPSGQRARPPRAPR